MKQEKQQEKQSKTFQTKLSIQTHILLEAIFTLFSIRMVPKKEKINK